VTVPRPLEIAARGEARPVPRPVAVPPAAGRGEIEVVRRHDGRSVVTRAYATSPLRLLTPINHGHAAWIYGSSYGGGLVDGDAVTLDVDLAPGAAAFVSTQASTKVYRSFRGTRSATDGRIGPGALLVLAPDPVVCYAGSRYRQSQRFAVDAAGALVLVDWVTSGRRAAGERWQFDEYDATTEVHVAGALVLHDRLRLRAAHGDLGSRLGRFDVLALVVLAGAGVAGEAAAIVGSVMARPLERRAPLLMSAAALRGGGCAVRLAGQSVEQVGHAIAKLLAFVPARLGDDPWSRKW
jgi:urease accessory protein